MSRFTRGLESDVGAVLMPKLSDISGQFAAEARADGWAEFLEQALLELARLAGIRQRVVFAALPGFFAAVSSHNERQFRLIVKANTGIALPPVVPSAPGMASSGSGSPLSTLGVAPFRSEPFLTPLAEGWVKENTALIKSIPQRFHTELETLLQRGVMNGASVRTLQDAIKEQYGVNQSRAKLIAQDQTLKLQSRLTEYRLKSVGVTRYIWRTVQDSRVRPKHVERSGKTFSWDSPPSGGQHPGQEVRCRCRAEAVWDD